MMEIRDKKDLVINSKESFINYREERFFFSDENIDCYNLFFILYI